MANNRVVSTAIATATENLNKLAAFRQAVYSDLGPARDALRFVGQWAPADARMWVVGDREFQDMALQAFVREGLGWHFVQRLDHTTSGSTRVAGAPPN